MVAALADEPAFAAAMPDRVELKARFSVETMARDTEAAYLRALGR